MFREEIPRTEARLPQSVELRILVPVKVNLGTAVSYQLQPGAVLGTIQKLTREQKRVNTRRYSLGRNAFEPYDIIPGRITTQLTLEKVVLYSDTSPFMTMMGSAFGTNLEDSLNRASKIDGDLMSLFGFVGGNLLYQQQAFAIQELVHQPNDSDQPSITTYMDCWFDTNPIEYDVASTEAKLIIQRANVTVGRVITSLSADKMSAAAARSILPNGISL